MSQQWYYSKGGQRQGPVTAENLRELAVSGQITPSDLVWKEGMNQWAEARKVKGLFPVSTRIQSPPPLPAIDALMPKSMPDAAPAAPGRVVNDYLERLSRDLIQAGWSDVCSRSHAGIIFELVGSRRFLITKWSVLVRCLQRFDRPTAEVIARDFETITSKSKSSLVGSCFLLCVVVDQIEPGLQQAITSDDFGLFGGLRMKGGGGIVLIADLEKKQVHGKVPSLPFDVHKFTKETRGILERAWIRTPT